MPLTPPPPAAPTWILQPSVADLARAESLHVSRPSGGHAVMNCYVRADGRLEACEVDVRKTTFGFEEAARAVQGAYRLDLTVPSPSPRLVVALDFPKVADTKATLIAEPSLDEVRAAAPMGVEGEVGLDCAITPAGAVESCAVASDPAHDARLDGPALSLAARYRFKPGVLAGKPVATFATIRIEVGASPHTIVRPDFARRPTANEVSSAYPRLAAASGLSGRAMINCLVDAAGRLGSCRVVEETPRGLGFGDAALQLSAKFAIRPMTVDGEPTEGGGITIPIVFKVEGARPPPPSSAFIMKVLPWAPWIRSPGAEDVAAAFPKRAAAAGEYGLASMMCAFRRDGRLKDCEPTTPLPRPEFDAAALSLAPRFQIDASALSAKFLDPLRVAITVAFSARALQPVADRYLRTPEWVRTADDGAIIAAYPEPAVKAGVLSGLATVECRVGSAGMLEACASIAETPTDLGFAQAALRVAPLMQANLWTRDGEAAVGQKVKLPLRFIFTAASTPPPASAPAR